LDIGITKMSSKGQVVIPQDMRDGFAEGDKLIVIRDEDRLVLRKASELDKQFLEDLEFAKRSDEAYERIQKGEGIEMDFDDFIEEMKKW
jgi:AbrB family looped-hinge helix DNA binding protein